MPYANKQAARAYQTKYQKTWRESRKTLVNGYNRRWRQKFPERVLVGSAKRRAKEMGLPFNLIAEDIVIPTRCPVLGTVLDRDLPTGAPRRVGKGRNGGGAPRPNAPSLDRIIPALGYVKGNVQVISWRANSLKKDATAAELQLVADFIRRQEDQ